MLEGHIAEEGASEGGGGESGTNWYRKEGGTGSEAKGGRMTSTPQVESTTVKGTLETTKTKDPAKGGGGNKRGPVLFCKKGRTKSNATWGSTQQTPFRTGKRKVGQWGEWQ